MDAQLSRQHLWHKNELHRAGAKCFNEFPKFIETFGPRGVIHFWATDKDDPTEVPRWGKVGKQKIEDTGPLTTKRMETCDDDFVAAERFYQATK